MTFLSLQEGIPCRCVKGALYPSRLRREHKLASRFAGKPLTLLPLPTFRAEVNSAQWNTLLPTGI